MEKKTCNVCYDDFVLKEIVSCEKCKNTCCRDCFKQYLINSDINVSCMFSECQETKNKLSLQFIILNTDIKWMVNTYKKYLMQLLFIEEKAKMNETQDAVISYMEAFKILHKSYSSYDHLTYEFKEQMFANANACISSYGKGWENFDFLSGESRPIESFSGITYPCTSGGCIGIVSNNICRICNTDYCKDCHEKITNNYHNCDPDLIATIKIIFSGGKPCPKCAVIISKVDGCDQMFCTQCHTTFSWTTGGVRNEARHNPHYFEWLDSLKKKVPEKIKDHECSEFISYKNLMSCFFHDSIMDARKLEKRLPSIYNFYEKLPSIEHYILAFRNLHSGILYIRATSGNHANIDPIDNHKYRVQLLLNEINEKTFKKKIVTDYLNFKKFISYFNVYNMVFQFTGILFDNLWAYTHNKIEVKSFKKKYMIKFEDMLHITYVEIQKILEQANEMIDYNDKAFGKDERFMKFSRHPFVPIKMPKVEDEDEELLENDNYYDY